MSIFERLSSRPIYAAMFVGVAAFVCYLFTLAPSVDFIDAGELATDCWVLGICHPTGYPLFTLVGWLFSHLPIASSIILRFNLMAAFFTAAGAGALTMVAYEIYQYWLPEMPKTHRLSRRASGQRTLSTRGTANRKSQPARKDEPAARAVAPEAVTSISSEEGKLLPLVAALATGLAAAYSATWWSQSTAIEVYPLHLFMVPIVLMFFLRMLRLESGDALGTNGKLFALTLGLAFANHMTTILLAPACLYMYFARYGFAKDSRMRIVRLAPFFLAGLALYLYLPIRSAMYPIMDWGHPSTLGAFLRHITGGQYKIWMFTGSGAASKQWSYFWSRVPTEFSIAGAALAIVGFIRMTLVPNAIRSFLTGVMLVLALACILFAVVPSGGDETVKAHTHLGLLILLLPLIAGLYYVLKGHDHTPVLPMVLMLFFGCLLYSINYDIHDIDSYFLLAYLAMSLWIGTGLLAIVKFVKTPKLAPILAALAVLLALVEINHNFEEVDESGNYVVEDCTKNMLTNLPQNAIVFSTQWDFWVSGAFYYQLVEKIRPDILVVDKAMLRDRPWYFAELEQRAPEVFRRIKPEENSFLKFLWAFDRGEKFDQAAIAPAYERVTTALVERNLDRPVFVTQEMVDQPDELFAPKMKFVPAGVAYRLLPRDSIVQADLPKITWRDVHYKKRNYYTDDARILQALPLVNYANTLLRRNDIAGAKQFLDAALKFTPDMGANLDNMNERDLSIANAANQKFTQIAALRRQLDGK